MDPHPPASHPHAALRLTRRRFTGAKLLAALILGAALQVAHGSALVHQTLHLVAGWNSVWLEVTPRHPDGFEFPAPPELVFTEPAITKVASFFPAQSPVEFISQPDQGFNQDGWQVWYRDDLAQQSNLGGILGHRGYLVHATSAVTLDIEGEATFHRVRWQPDSFNLVGFGIVPGSEPTFARFFDNSRAHNPLNAFQLIAGQWVGVSRTDRIQPGQAYWIYSAGPSDFQGPLHVTLPGSDGLIFGSAIDDQELVFAHASTQGTLTNRLERVTDPGGLELVTVLPPDPVHFVRAEGTAVVSLDLENLAPKQTAFLTLRAKRQWTSGAASRTNLYRLSSSVGTYFWLPVRATRADLRESVAQRPSRAKNQGLWIGEVTIQNVSRLQSPDPASAIEPTADRLPVRLLVHVDDQGQSRLLKQVTLMRRKRGSAEVDPGLVLVTDERLLPQFEGIQRRGERLVGQRIETASYDLPRRSAILSPPRPPHPLTPGFDRSTLEEDYLVSLDLDGSVGSGMSLRTRPGSLVLDPWHRTNPFRHAFHEQHQQGPRIVREMMLLFDEVTSEAATAQTRPGIKVLSGTYTESIEGLSKPGERLTLSGPFQLRQISDVAQLHGN